MGKLDNRTALVTGGGSGIGLAIAEAFAKEGAKVLLVGRRESVLQEACENNANFCYVAADITKTEEVAKVAEYVKDNFDGKLNVLVNNAGWCPVQPLKAMTISDYDQAFDLDVRALVDMTIQTLPYILAAKGNIINLSSVGVTHRAANLSMYQGAKAAVENFTRVWAIELAGDGVRVNAIAPGAIRTDIWNVPGLTEEQNAEHEKAITSGVPFKRFGRPEEVGAIALFLASDDSSYVSGSVYAVDGAMGA